MLALLISLSITNILCLLYWFLLIILTLFLLICLLHLLNNIFMCLFYNMNSLKNIIMRWFYLRLNNLFSLLYENLLFWILDWYFYFLNFLLLMNQLLSRSNIMYLIMWWLILFDFILHMLFNLLLSSLFDILILNLLVFCLSVFHNVLCNI